MAESNDNTCVSAALTKTVQSSSEPASNGVEVAIERLQAILNENYLSAESIMSVRTPNTVELNTVSGKIDQLYDELIGTLTKTSASDEIVATASKISLNLTLAEANG